MTLGIAIVGGETHLGEITNLSGREARIVAVAVRPDQVDWANGHFTCRVATDFRDVLSREDVDVVAVANENDRKAEAILAWAVEKMDSLRPITATSAPASSNPSAIPRPKPRLPPVTRAFLPVKSNSFIVILSL